MEGFQEFFKRGPKQEVCGSVGSRGKAPVGGLGEGRLRPQKLKLNVILAYNF